MWLFVILNASFYTALSLAHLAFFLLRFTYALIIPGQEGVKAEFHLKMELPLNPLLAPLNATFGM